MKHSVIIVSISCVLALSAARTVASQHSLPPTHTCSTTRILKAVLRAIGKAPYPYPAPGRY